MSIAKELIFEQMEKDRRPFDEVFEQGPFETQVGGGHYVEMAIQPADYILKNKLGYAEGNVVKYISRWRKKGGVSDLRKAKHYIDLLIDTEVGKR